MREIAKTFVAEDGTSFSDPGDANRHDLMVEALDALKDAQSVFTKAMIVTQKTADGRPFSLFPGRYYRVIKSGYDSPRVESISIPFMVSRIEISRDNSIEFRILMDPHSSRGSHYWIDLRFDELYEDEQAAKVACLMAKREWLKEVQEDVADFERRIRV